MAAKGASCRGRLSWSSVKKGRWKGKREMDARFASVLAVFVSTRLRERDKLLSATTREGRQNPLHQHQFRLEASKAIAELSSLLLSSFLADLQPTPQDNHRRVVVFCCTCHILGISG